MDEAALMELLAGQSEPVAKREPEPLPEPHAFPGGGPPTGPPGTEPIPPPEKGKGRDADDLSPWDYKRKEESNAAAGKKSSAVMDSLDAHYKLYVQSSPNNCIMTLVNEVGKSRGIVSAGLCGFRNSQEATYEAGYQVAVRMFDKIRSEMALRTDKKMKIEILMKGFGQSRQALLKALTMTEGVGVRESVVRLTDRTPIKIGGVRAQKARRM